MVCIRDRNTPSVLADLYHWKRSKELALGRQVGTLDR